MRAPFRTDVALFLILTVGNGDAALRVISKAGNIVLEDSSGDITPLTHTGDDFEPWLTRDGRTVVFIRQSPENFRTSVYTIDVRTRTVSLLYAGPARYAGRESWYFSGPELNESHETLFLVSDEYATEGALIGVQLANGKVTLISDHVVGYDVINCPASYRGDLLALKRHEEDILGRPYFLYYLYSATGLELGLAGEGELDTELDFIRGGRCKEPEHQTSRPLPADSIQHAVDLINKHPTGPTVTANFAP